LNSCITRAADYRKPMILLLSAPLSLSNSAKSNSTVLQVYSSFCHASTAKLLHLRSLLFTAVAESRRQICAGSARLVANRNKPESW